MKFKIFTFLVFFSTFFWAQAPTITSFSPTSAEVGDTVTITGTGFDATPANNVVYFGGVKAIVNSANSTEIVVEVPSGAKDEPITITSNGKTVESSLSFITSNSVLSALPVNSDSFGTGLEISSNTSGNSWYQNDNFVAISDFNVDGKNDIVKLAGNTVRAHKNTSTSGVLDSNSFDAGADFSLRNTTHYSLIAKDINIIFFIIF